MAIQLKNPHSVQAALETRPSDVLQLHLPRDPSPAWERVARLARDHGIKVAAPSRGPSKDGGREGGISALVREREGIPVEKLFEDARERAKGKGLWLALDSLQDPQNVGAIFRTAAFFGVQGILLTEERSAPLSSTVYDVAAGGVEYVPFTIQTNLQRAFEVAKDAGLWILGTSEHDGDRLTSIQKDRPWLLVLGNEERGMRRLTQETCDVLCQIPPQGRVTSLNVSVASGICISHLS